MLSFLAWSAIAGAFLLPIGVLLEAVRDAHVLMDFSRWLTSSPRLWLSTTSLSTESYIIYDEAKDAHCEHASLAAPH